MKTIVISVLALFFSTSLFSQETIQMKRLDSGLFQITGKVNGLDLIFLFDTGASDISISLTEALFMLKNGHLEEKDIKGSSYSQLANGDILENTSIILKNVQIGNTEIHNVKATIVHNLDAPLLLGQSAIQQLGPIQLDGDKLIILKGNIQKSEKEARKNYDLAYQQYEAEDYLGSIESSEKALLLTDDETFKSWIYDNLALCYFELGEIDQALECCIKGLSEDSCNHSISYNYGYILYAAGKKDLALKAFTQFINRIPYYDDPGNHLLAAGYAYLGELQADKGELLNAERNLMLSIKYEPLEQAYRNLGKVYEERNETKKAIDNYIKGTNFEPNRLSNIKIYKKIGYLYLKIKEKDNAIIAFNKCIDCYNYNKEIVLKAFVNQLEGSADFIFDFVESNIELGRLYTQKNSFEKSLENYEIVLREPDAIDQLFDLEDYYALSYDYLRLGKKDNAKEMIEKGLIKFMNNPDLLYLKAEIYLGDLEIVINCLNDIIKQENIYKPFSFRYDYAYYNLGLAYYHSGDFSKALIYIKKSIDLNPKRELNWEYLGRILFAQGQYNECIDAINMCLRINPDNKKAYGIRGNAYIRIGKKKEGKKDLKIANGI